MTLETECPVDKSMTMTKFDISILVQFVLTFIFACSKHLVKFVVVLFWFWNCHNFARQCQNKCHFVIVVVKKFVMTMQLSVSNCHNNDFFDKIGMYSLHKYCTICVKKEWVSYYFKSGSIGNNLAWIMLSHAFEMIPLKNG